MAVKCPASSRITFLLLCGIYILTLSSLNAKKKKTDNTGLSIFQAEWKTNGLVSKLYDTPLGEVFNFSPTLPGYMPRSSWLRNKNLDTSMHSIQFELYKNSREQERMRRYIAIDFKFRVFPAVSEVKNPKLYFRFTRSMNAAGAIKTILDIDEESSYKNFPFFSVPHRFPNYQIKKKNTIKIEGTPSAGLGRTALKPYEAVSMRLIIDRYQNSVVSSNINGCLFIEENKYPYPDGLYEVRSFGICLNAYMPQRRYILEVSKPQIMFTDKPEDLQTLPALNELRYPYDKYLLNKIKKGKNLKRLKNPDEIYAHALHLLQGEDLVEGVKLLTYIAKDKEHILAMNQLGICYWRGIGVDPDMKKAFEWFDMASEYLLPEALNLAGVLKLKESQKPYMNERDKGFIFRHLKSWGIKRKVVQLAAAKEWIRTEYSRSKVFAGPEKTPKSDLWKIIFRNNYLIYPRNAYYTKPKMARYVADGLVKSRSIDEKTEREKLLKNLDLAFQKQMKELDEGIKKGFIPAIYYKGRLLISRSTKEERKSAMKGALDLFKRGEKFGDFECAIEALHCQAGLGTLKPEDFDNELYMKFSDHPLYYLLRYMVKNPDAPGVKEFLCRDYRGARSAWEKKTDPMSHFLLALEGIYHFFHCGRDTMYYRMYYGDVDDIKAAYKHLDAAVKSGIQDAAYLKGVYLIDRLYSDNTFFKDAGRSVGVNLLDKIAKTGNVKAQFHLIKYYFDNSSTVSTNWLKQLKPLRDMQFPEAWMLSCDILARSHKGGSVVNEKVAGAYKKAASLGCFRAWDRLAKLYYKNGRGSDEDKAAAERYWKKFLTGDRKQRCNDMFDPYWPNPERVEIIKSYSDGSLSPVSPYKMTKKEACSYFRKFYNFDHLKVINAEDDPAYAPEEIFKGGPVDSGEVDKFLRGKTKKEKFRFKKGAAVF